MITCKHQNGALFQIDTVNNILVWDLEGWNREAELYKTVSAINKDEVFISGVYEKHVNGNSYASPTISIDDIVECDNVEALEQVFNI